MRADMDEALGSFVEDQPYGVCWYPCARGDEFVCVLGSGRVRGFEIVFAASMVGDADADGGRFGGGGGVVRSGVGVK